MSRHLAPGASGATLLATMIGLGLALTTIAMTAVGYRQLMFARRTVEASGAVREADQALTGAALKALKDYVKGGCTSVATGKINLGAAFGKIQASQDVGQAVAGNPELPQSYKDAMARCSSHAAGSAAATTVYGCFDFVPPATAGKKAADSFVNAKAAFVEFYGNIRDFKTNALTTCSATTSSPTAGLAGYYVLYWVLNSNQGYVYKTKTGVLYSDI